MIYAVRSFFPMIEVCIGDFFDSRLIMSRSCSLKPYLERERSVGISSLRWVTRVEPNCSIVLVRVVPEKLAVSEVQESR
jgi:hypothetical protein